MTPLERYHREAQDPGASGPEHLQMLHRRDQLAEREASLTAEERLMLREADECLLSNANAFHAELAACIDLAQRRLDRKIPPHHWWWYLDVIAHLPTRQTLAVEPATFEPRPHRP